jgi:type VI secretion system protein ImpC
MTQATETTQTQPAAAMQEGTEFSELLKREFKTQTARDEVEVAVKTLAEQALAVTTTVSADVAQTIQGIIAEIDKKLTEQVNEILHNADFMKLEAAWRGLHYLVTNTETDSMLKIRVMNVSKKDLHKTLKKFKGAA